MTRSKRVRIELYAGVYSSPTFLEGFRQALRKRFEEAGWEPDACLGFPYGDWSRPLPGQVREVWRDLRLKPERCADAHGAGRVWGEWTGGGAGAAGPFGVDALVLIGHSGGGTAALQAAARLLQERARRQGHPAEELRDTAAPSALGNTAVPFALGHTAAPSALQDTAAAVPPILVVQIGSPRTPVPPELRPHAAYCFLARPDGSPKDPICRLGSWKRWRLRPQAPFGGLGLARLVRKAYPPGAVMALRMPGGHADYFRSQMVGDGGRSNLEVTLDAVWKFLEEKLGMQPMGEGIDHDLGGSDSAREDGAGEGVSGELQQG